MINGRNTQGRENKHPIQQNKSVFAYKLISNSIPQNISKLVDKKGYVEIICLCMRKIQFYWCLILTSDLHSIVTATCSPCCSRIDSLYYNNTSQLWNRLCTYTALLEKATNEAHRLLNDSCYGYWTVLVQGSVRNIPFKIKRLLSGAPRTLVFLSEPYTELINNLARIV